MNECFADEIAIDFPSVGPVVDRMRDAFLGERVDADVLRAQVSLTQREASGGLVVTLEVPVRVTCPNCGNDRNFLVKTLQMHVVNVEAGRVEVSEESRPAVLEVLCDECESALNFEEFEDTLRKEVLLTIGAR